MSHGLGIINNAKSSYSADENFFYITCARSPLYAHHAPPHVLSGNEQKRYLDQGEQEFVVKIVQGKNNWQKADMPRRSLEFLQPPVAHLESAHSGNLIRSDIKIEVNPSNILVTVIKQEFEKIKGSVILRVVESFGIETAAKIRIPMLNTDLEATFHPFEIKSFSMKNGKILEINGIEDLIKV
jgi:alpha-mannosidase